MLRVVRGLIYLIVTVLLLTQVALAGFALYVKKTDQQMLEIIGGSMEPVYSVGDAVIIDKDTSHIVPGEVVTFHDHQKLTTHRVLEIRTIKGQQWLQTQGDANDTPDPDLTPIGAVIGIPRFSISHGGEISQWLQSRAGRVLTFGPALLTVLILEFAHVARTWREDDEEDETGEDGDDTPGPDPDADTDAAVSDMATDLDVSSDVEPAAEPMTVEPTVPAPVGKHRAN